MNRTVDVVIPVYNAASHVCETVRRINEQQLPDGWSLTIYAADDGSTDDSRQMLSALREEVPALNLVCADDNHGRSQACNDGIRAGSGSIVLICDADCRYTRDDTIAGFLTDIEQGQDVVIGLVELPGQGFWARYTNSVATNRVTNESSRGLMSYTTANIGMRRSAFESLGGFSSAYGEYGFEDKDLLIRVERAQLSVSIREDIRVSHDDDFSLAVVCQKAEDSGRYSAAAFRQRFPDEYSRLPYASCDAATASGMRLLQPLAAPLKMLARALAAAALVLPTSLFRLQRFAVRVAICSAYFHGTARALKQSGKPHPDK